MLAHAKAIGFYMATPSVPLARVHPRPLPKGVASITYYLCNTGGTGSEIGPRQSFRKTLRKETDHDLDNPDSI